MPFSRSTPATLSPPLQMAAKYTSPVASNFVIGLTVCAGIAFAKTSDARSGAEKKQPSLRLHHQLKRRACPHGGCLIAQQNRSDQLDGGTIVIHILSRIAFENGV